MDQNFERDNDSGSLLFLLRFIPVYAHIRLSFRVALFDRLEHVDAEVVLVLALVLNPHIDLRAIELLHLGGRKGNVEATTRR